MPLGRKESFNTVGDTFQFPGRSLLMNRASTAVSPVRQRAAKNLFRGYLFNGYRRLSSQVGYWIVPVVLGTFLGCSPVLITVPVGSTLSPPLLKVTQRTHGPRSTTPTLTVKRVTLLMLESIRYYPFAQ